MKLYATTTSERASKGQGGNEYISIDLNVHREVVGQVELYLHNDTGEGCLHDFIDDQDKDAVCQTCGYCKSNKCEEDEWVLYFRKAINGKIDYDIDPEIIAQGNISPKLKGKSQKGECVNQNCHNIKPKNSMYCDNCRFS